MTEITVINGGVSETVPLKLLLDHSHKFVAVAGEVLKSGNTLAMKTRASANTFRLFMDALRKQTLDEVLTIENLKEIRDLAQELDVRDFLAVCDKFSASMNAGSQLHEDLMRYIDKRVDELSDEKWGIAEELKEMYQDLAETFKKADRELEVETACQSRKLNEMNQRQEDLAKQVEVQARIAEETKQLTEQLSEKILSIQTMISEGNKTILDQITETTSRTSESIRAQINQLQTDFGQRLSQVEMKQEQHAKSLQGHTVGRERLLDEITALGKKTREQHAEHDRRVEELEERLRKWEQTAKDVDYETIPQMLQKQGRFERKLNAIVQQMGDVRRGAADLLFADTPDYEQRISDLTDALHKITLRLTSVEADVEKQASIPPKPPEVDRAQLKAVEEKLTAQLNQAVGLTNTKFNQLDLKVDKHHTAITLIKTMLKVK